ncbi:MAG: sodium:calcium antiporter [Cytophagales bacterium]|nr:sodium:calcium antiporter [Cytophagales bacterium]
MGVVIPLLLITFCCLIIWRAGDGFMVASEYVGRNLSEGVRGATINAIASSMPEVFTSLFFLFVLQQDGIGFTGGIGTTAGSAIFNSMVIPAVAVLAVISMGLTKQIEVSRKVMLRDGIALIIAEFIFLTLISGSVLRWYHGLILMLVYVVYIIYMFASMNRKERDDMLKESHLTEEDFDIDHSKNESIVKAIFTFDLERIFIGKSKINGGNAWSLLIFSTLSIAAVCFFLVKGCEWIGTGLGSGPGGEESYHLFGMEFVGLGIPVMFVALILASAASSFPDTIISMKDAKKGNYDDAISNALGSNIFDVCFALGLPLMIFTLMNGPIEMPEAIVKQSTELRFLLWLLTILVVAMFISGKYLGKHKSYLLLGMYALFVVYVVGRGTGSEIAQSIADWLVSTAHLLGIG